MHTFCAIQVTIPNLDCRHSILDDLLIEAGAFRLVVGGAQTIGELPAHQHKSSLAQYESKT